ncbi:hypothetical protein CC1G_09406 [Coprinopsis cinerea okayama7|uniref:Uncharacterized protein n=1 Tax=Coprinopsis cinerea (strain Okayama-7 / 130 / ATCC MYA-4618 / FGSC 9003) TaxID=240176 RepID=A8NIG6_COPC7|nr:hypothetical protein CC1G_09406 [Coprinopsis cinerea okayama7\|eukprot:XP_001833992.1 hypothetical protein CC1G_09406 [Coprinopsis cinerea okayama7\
MKSFAVLSAVVAVAVAQSNPLIPSGISDSCRTFLTNLNTNADIAKCTDALTTALSSFAPGKTDTATASDITGALNNLCSTSTTAACPSSVISSQVTNFYAACPDELTSSPNADVVRMYDIIFSIVPMQKAICSKGDDGKWCVMSGNPLSDSSASDLQSSLYTQDGQTIIPNTDAFSSNNLPFLLLSPDLDKEALCTACTRNVLSAYITYESDVPYAPGLGKSQLLGEQGALFSAVQEKCGAKFMDNEIKAAGGLGTSNGNGIFSSGAAPSIDVAFQSLMAVFAGFTTLAVTAAL